MQHQCRCSCARGADVPLRDVTIAQMEKGATECGWRHAPEARGVFWGFWKSQLFELSWVLPSEEERWLLLAHRGLGRVSHEIGSRWKSQNRKNVYLSPYVEEPLNSKLIKSFVPELRSRKCFSCFEIPMFYVYMLWTVYVRFTYPYHEYDIYIYIYIYIYVCVCVCVSIYIYIYSALLFTYFGFIPSQS